MSTKKQMLPVLMWLIPVSFFAYQFILRLWPSLMMQSIMQQFSIDATAFGFLASVYYYGYAGMQIPIALLLDRFGVRLVVVACALICAVAMVIFSATNYWWAALLSRFLIGVGSAVGFLGTSAVIAKWFSKDRYGRMVGFSFTVGLLGAIYGGVPLSQLIHHYDWHYVAYGLALTSFLIAVLCYFCLRMPKQASVTPEQNKFSFDSLLQLLKSPRMWLLALANLLMVGTLEGFADVWGVNYLMTAFNFSKSYAAGLVSFIFVGMLFGGPLLAILSRKFGEYTMIVGCGVGLAALFLQLLFGHSYANSFYLGSLFFLMGVLSCYQVLIFAAASQWVSAAALGVTVAFLNCINMLGGSFFHSIIGLLMDKFWTGETIEGTRQYTIGSYDHALLIIPVCAVVGAVIVMVLAKNSASEIISEAKVKS